MGTPRVPRSFYWRQGVGPCCNRPENLRRHPCATRHCFGFNLKTIPSKPPWCYQGGRRCVSFNLPHFSPWLLSGVLNFSSDTRANANTSKSPSLSTDVQPQNTKNGALRFSNPPERGSEHPQRLSLEDPPTPLPAAGAGLWSLKLVMEKAANEFRLCSFQNLMFCNDDISVATEGPRRQVCAAALRFETPRQWGQCSRALRPPAAFT